MAALGRPAGFTAKFEFAFELDVDVGGGTGLYCCGVVG